MSALASQRADSGMHWHPGLLAALLRCDRLTLVYSPAGAARDAMLRRMLLPLLGRRRNDAPLDDAPPPSPPFAVERRREHPASRRGAEIVLRFDAWGAAPLTTLREQLATQLNVAPGDAPHDLSTLLRVVGRRHDAQLLLVLDGFERHLGQPRELIDELRRFDEQFVDWIRRPDVPAHALLLVDDASQTLLQQRFATALPQIAHGWLRLRPPVIAAAVAVAGADDAATARTAPAEDFAPRREPLQPGRPVVPPQTAHAREPKESARGPVARGPSAGPAFDDIGTVAPGLEAVDPHPPAARTNLATAASAVRADWNDDDGAPGRSWPRLLALGVAVVAVLLSLSLWWLEPPDSTPVPRVAATDARRDDAAPRPVAPPAGTEARPQAGAVSPPSGAVAQSPSGQSMTPPAATDSLPAAPANGSRDAVASPPPSTAVVSFRVALPAGRGANDIGFDRLQQVAAPAGIRLVAAAPGEAAPLAIWRHDALLAARARGETRTLRVLAPVHDEYVQVLVRADSRWRFLHQLQGLHLNLGESGGARDQAAQALYRTLFGRAVPAWDTDHRDQASALRSLVAEGSALDAVLVVSDGPPLEQVPAAMRTRLRALALDPAHRGSRDLLRTFGVAPGRGGDSSSLLLTSYLATPLPPSAAQDAAFTTLAAAACRGAAALRPQGDEARQRPATDWPWLLAGADAAAGCASLGATAAAASTPKR